MNRLSRNLQADVENLCRPDGRVVGTPGHEEARRYLCDRVIELRLEPYDGRREHTYLADGIEGTNIVATLPGRNRGLPPLLFGAHYDSLIKAPCADDNGAAVAILLALAKALRGADLPRDVVFAIFDAEEPPHYLTPAMGSIRFYADQMDARGVHAAVVMDLVGHDVPVESLNPLGFAIPGTGRLKDLLVMTGAESHPAFEQCLRAAAVPDRLSLVATANDNVGDMSDHAVFRWNGQPYLFFSCGRWEHYHEPTDTPDRLNYLKMARLAMLLEDLARRLCSTELPRQARKGAKVLDPYGALAGDEGDGCRADTTAFEIATLEAAFGPLMPLLKKLAGVKSLGTREDLQRIIAVVKRAGL